MANQYFKIVNLSKKEYISPFNFNEEMGIFDFTLNSVGSAAALAILLADGGDDINSIIDTGNMSIPGRWAGDRIVIAGDWANDGNWMRDDKANKNLYQVCADNTIAKDISLPVLDVLLDDKRFYMNFAIRWDSQINSTRHDLAPINTMLQSKEWYGEAFKGRVKQTIASPRSTVATSTAQIWPVLSSDGKRTYNVKRMGNDWTCECPGYIFNRKDCKHITQTKSSLAVLSHFNP